MINSIDLLPQDTQRLIFSYLGPKDFYDTIAVSRQWKVFSLEKVTECLTTYIKTWHVWLNSILGSTSLIVCNVQKQLEYPISKAKQQSQFIDYLFKNLEQIQDEEFNQLKNAINKVTSNTFIEDKFLSISDAICLVEEYRTSDLTNIHFNLRGRGNAITDLFYKCCKKNDFFIAYLIAQHIPDSGLQSHAYTVLGMNLASSQDIKRLKLITTYFTRARQYLKAALNILPNHVEEMMEIFNKVEPSAYRDVGFICVFVTCLKAGNIALATQAFDAISKDYKIENISIRALSLDISLKLDEFFETYDPYSELHLFSLKDACFKQSVEKWIGNANIGRYQEEYNNPASSRSKALKFFIEYIKDRLIQSKDLDTLLKAVNYLIPDPKTQTFLLKRVVEALKLSHIDLAISLAFTFSTKDFNNSFLFCSLINGHRLQKGLKVIYEIIHSLKEQVQLSDAIRASHRAFLKQHKNKIKELYEAATFIIQESLRLEVLKQVKRYQRGKLKIK